MDIPRRSTLIVDLVQFEAALARMSPVAAHAMRTHPARWLDWIESSAPPTTRRFMRRVVLLDPACHRHARAALVLAGCAIIDCIDPLARDAATTVELCQEVFQALDTPTEEVFLIAGNRNIQPLLGTIRRAGRQAVVVAAADRSMLYRHEAEAISYDMFIDAALGLRDTSVRQQAVLAAIAADLTNHIARTGPLPVAQAAARMTRFAEFRDAGPRSQWLGHGSLRQLLGVLASIEPRLHIGDGVNAQITLDPDPAIAPCQWSHISRWRFHVRRAFARARAALWSTDAAAHAVDCSCDTYTRSPVRR